MDDANIEKRTASGIAVSLSSYLITGSLAILGAQAVVVTFTLDKKQHLISFGVVSALAFMLLIGSIVWGGKGIIELAKSGYEGTWKVSSRAGRFNVQAILTLLGVVLLGLSTLLGSPKEASTEKHSQVDRDTLRATIIPLEQRLQSLEQSRASDHLIIEGLTKALASRNRRGGTKQTGQ